MSPRIGSKIGGALAAAFVIASVAASLGAVNASAATRDRHAAIAAHRGNAAHPVRRAHRFARSNYRGLYGDVAPGGYVFVPGRGILGESCNLPTSTCSNEYRDVQ